MSQVTSHFLLLLCIVLPPSLILASAKHFEDDQTFPILNPPVVNLTRHCSIIIFQAEISILVNKLWDSVVQKDLITRPDTKYIYIDCKAIQPPFLSGVFPLPPPIAISPDVKEFSIPVVIQKDENATGTLYYNIQFDVRTKKYAIRGGDAYEMFDDRVGSLQGNIFNFGPIGIEHIIEEAS